MENKKKENKNNLVIPDTLLESFNKGLKPSNSRAVVFENDKQRNIGVLRKGLMKPGQVSFEVLRRAVNAVPVARICVDTLKKKIAKTKWVIRTIDPMAKADEQQVKEITDLLKNPNDQDSMRSFLDKILEDLLVLDAVAIEKTRFPDGKLAQMYQVDASTIRPVYDEMGKQDIPVPLPNGETPPVSYLQIFNNSMYGGPESGEIVAAWAKKDFMYFHMNPQGTIDNFGYGLSPIEAVLSVVSNLLNADNFNGNYFDEGAFPPIILQLAQSLDVRQLEAYREYLYNQIEGNFHKPAIVAGGGEMKVHNLKDLTNREMQFMEYTLWLSKLMCAAYGLSPDDIGLTDTTGSKSVAESQKEISEGKGYGSYLDLLKEIINSQIIWKDFGYTDLEFEWVAIDSLDPKTAVEIQDIRLKNGTMTVNEVREKNGDLPFEDWADQPMVLGNDGYSVIHTDEHEEITEEDEVQGEKVYSKSAGKTLYIQRNVKNAKDIIKWAKSNGFKTTLQPDDMHVTIAFSRKNVNWDSIDEKNDSFKISGGKREMAKFRDAIVLKFSSKTLQNRWKEIIQKGASWDYESYQPHISITYAGDDIDLSKIKPYTGDIILAPEERNEVSDDWIDNVSEKGIRKAIYTPSGFKTWMDDRGFGQPFIVQSILDGGGWVIKPPVAVNLTSQDLEIELTNLLYKKGLNVNPVKKMLYTDVVAMFGTADIKIEFDKYVNMTPEYDSEKWRARFGGSRKYPYYLMSDYIDGFALNSNQIRDDMKRDPTSYTQAIIDLAKLWKTEKELVLGDRRADQYIITKDKCAYGIDYQFQGDVKRWEDTKDAIPKFLVQIPQLYNLFMSTISDENKTTKKQGIIKRIKDLIK